MQDVPLSKKSKSKFLEPLRIFHFILIYKFMITREIAFEPINSIWSLVFHERYFLPERQIWISKIPLISPGSSTIQVSQPFQSQFFIKYHLESWKQEIFPLKEETKFQEKDPSKKTIRYSYENLKSRKRSLRTKLDQKQEKIMKDRKLSLCSVQGKIQFQNIWEFFSKTFESVFPLHWVSRSSDCRFVQRAERQKNLALKHFRPILKEKWRLKSSVRISDSPSLWWLGWGKSLESWGSKFQKRS